MRLPQDRILHIDTEFENGKVNVVAEWQGELVRCKDCRHLDVWNLKNIYAVCSKHSITFEPFEDDTRTHFCSWGERRKSEKEYLDKTFPEHDGGEWFDITDMMTGESKK